MQQTINFIDQIERPQKDWLDASILLWANMAVAGIMLVIGIAVFSLGALRSNQYHTLQQQMQHDEVALEKKRRQRDQHVDPAHIQKQIDALQTRLKSIK